MDYYLELSRSGGLIDREAWRFASVRMSGQDGRASFRVLPPGNGTDTHRMWEALYAGAIPVVQRHPALDAFSDLPILFVDELRSIAPQTLEREYERMRTLTWNTDKLFLPWWRKQLAAAKADLQGRASQLAWRIFLRLKMTAFKRFEGIAAV